MPSAFEHGPSLTVPASNTTAKAAVIWSAASNLGESTIILDSGGNGRIGIAGDLDVITLTSGTVTVAGTVAATTLTGAGAGITALAAANITASGTLPALNGAALTALNGTQVTSGTLPAARIAADSIVEGKLNVSNGPTNGYVLTARDGVAGGFTWEAAASGGVDTTGTPANNQIATFTDADTLQGESTFTYTGTAMMIGLAASPPTPDHVSVHIWEGDAGLTSSTDMQLVVENSGNAGIAVLSPNANSTQIAFGSPQDNRQGGILYDHNTNSLHLRAAGITVMELDTSGFGGQPKIKVGTATNNTFGFWTKNTQSVGTSLTYIIAGSDNVTDQGALVFVSGRESSGSQHKFYDLLMHTYRDTTSAGPTVISSSNASSPASRSYDQNQSGLRLAMASGTYDVSVFVISAPNVN